MYEAVTFWYKTRMALTSPPVPPPSQEAYKQQQEQFFSSVQSPMPLVALIDHLPATYFFAKDRAGRFVHVNRALLEVLGLSNELEIAGKTDADFFLPEVAQRYRDQDQQVMESGQALVDHVCGVPDASGLLRWYVETKIPLHDAKQQVIGVAGIMHDLEKAGATLAPYQRLSQAITHVNSNYPERITAETLAQLAHLSVSQFNRTFKKLFNITPAQYIVRVRVIAACSLLRTSSDNIETIAAETGFYDASHFTRQFRKIMQQTPKAYRNQCMNSASGRLIEHGLANPLTGV